MPPTGDAKSGVHAYLRPFGSVVGAASTAPVMSVHRRQGIGRVLAETDWVDLSIDVVGGEEDAPEDAARCILERLVEEHIVEAAAGGPPGAGDELTAADAAWRSDLRHFVKTMESHYNPVPFHSYHHVTHVTLSANRLMAGLWKDKLDASASSPSPLGRRLLGMSPLEKFAFVFTALIHDVDHVGISNAQLEMENHPVQAAYSHPKYLKSYAESNSVDIALNVLGSQERYGNLRSVLFNLNQDRHAEQPAKVFQNLVHHLVMCTDIASVERRKLGMERWESSFSTDNGKDATTSATDEGKDGDDDLDYPSDAGKKPKSCRCCCLCYCGGADHSGDEGDEGDSYTLPKSSEPSPAKAENDELLQLRRRSILEQLMQLADVSHLTQSWETFLKWNRRLYVELIHANERTMKHGARDSNDENAPKHPSEGWYEGQIGFYDFYIIPLAKRVEGCGVLGGDMASGIVANATRNRDRWKEEGRAVTERMIAEVAAEATTNVEPSSKQQEQRRTRRLSFADDNGLALESIESTSSLAAVAGNIERSESPSSLENGNADVGIADMPNGILLDTVDPISPPTEEVDAIVPSILVKQLIRCIEETPEKGSSLKWVRRAIASYHMHGSISRYRTAVLFVDVSGFTNLSQLYAVEDFKTFINEYFTKIIDIIKAHGGEVVKFAGDALFAIWTTPESAIDSDDMHAISVARCIACGVEINSKCNNYRVSKAYTRNSSALVQPSVDVTPAKQKRRRSMDMASMVRKDLGEMRLEGTVNVDGGGLGFDEQIAYLNVHCGIGEGVVAGVDVCANGRSEFFLFGEPLADVAHAESQAEKGELVISPSATSCIDTTAKGTSLEGTIIADALSHVCFVDLKGGFCKVTSKSFANGPRVTSSKEDHSANAAVGALHGHEFIRPASYESDMSAGSTKGAMRRRKSLISVEDSIDFLNEVSENWHEGSGDPDVAKVSRDMLALLNLHSHEATRGVNDKMMSAELRNVVVLFIKVHYEPKLQFSKATKSCMDDDVILDMFQCIFNIIHESLSQRKGQIRQFISDDKGTVCLASFGLRGSATLNLAATAVGTAQLIRQRLMDEADTMCTVGITLGKTFCGKTGSPTRHEFSIIGPSVNLSARLMANGTPGMINCDQEIAQSDTEHDFTCNLKLRLKGYEDLVPCYQPVVGDHETAARNDQDGQPASVRKDEVEDIVDSIQHQRELIGKEENPLPRFNIVTGCRGAGKTQFIRGVLSHPGVANEMTVLETNHCYHNSPFYCWVPLISKIAKTSKDVMKRLGRLKRTQKMSIPSSLLTRTSIYHSKLITNEELIGGDLLPYLSLVNDFMFQGLPLFPSTTEAKSMKESQRVTKTIEVLSAMLRSYLRRCGNCGIIAFHDMDAMDEYSKQLIRRLFESKSHLLFLGTTTQGSKRRLSVSMNSLDGSGEGDRIFESIIGQNYDEGRTTITRLKSLGKDTIFQVFIHSMKNVAEEDRLILEEPEIREQVYELCGGIPKYAVEFAQAASIELKRLSLAPSSIKRSERVKALLRDFPLTKMEEMITFRFDHLSSEAQVVLKVASVAGFDQYSFSLHLLETLMLDFIRDGPGIQKRDSFSSDTSSIPTKIVEHGDSAMDNIFQGDNFELIVQSLVEQNFLIDIKPDMADYLTEEGSQCFRFANKLEQVVINDVMLDVQKKRLHHFLARYYESRLLRADDESTMDEKIYDGATVSTYTSSTYLGSSVQSQNWQMSYLTATHYCHAGTTIAALLYFFDSSTELARLGVRDKSHGSLLSAYSMFEQRLSECLHAKNTVHLDARAHERNRVATRLLGMICEFEVPVSFQSLTRDHLMWMFDKDVAAFVKCIKMLTKCGQSIGIYETEGDNHGTKVYMQVIFLTLLGLSDQAFLRTTSQLSEFLQDSIGSGVAQEQRNDLFCIDDLTASFPAFSGLLTFYRDSPIQNEAKLTREKILATLFVAITDEMKDLVHILRTKCILSHLYMKTGEVDKALEVSENIKSAYNHDVHSLEIVQLYGMDWVLVNIMTMTSVYLLRGDIVRSLQSISFLEAQLEKLDEFASSAKVMLKSMMSSVFLILRKFDSAAIIADGVSRTSYGFFFKPSAILQEGLNKKLECLNTSLGSDYMPASNGVLSLTVDPKVDPSDAFSTDFDVLSIIDDAKKPEVRGKKRTMLHQSIEVLSDRGIEAIEAEICAAEMKWLEREYQSHSSQKDYDENSRESRKILIAKKQLSYCEAGIAHLEQSLCQKDATSHEKRTNHLSCLYQRAELLVWRADLSARLQPSATPGNVETDPSHSFSLDKEHAMLALRECEALSFEHGYMLMLLMVGARYSVLNLDPSHGKEVVSRTLRQIKESKNPADVEHAKVIYGSLSHPQL